jgi:hypothetical protein
MKIDRYYDITALPALDELGSEPPIEPADLRAGLAGERGRYELVGSLFLQDDLLQREAYLAGELEEVEPVVLSVGQARNESPLPEFFVLQPGGGAEESRGLDADRLWEAYFRYVAGLARRRRSPFLAAWVGHEVALRNALAAERARRLGLEESDYLVATDLAGEGDFAGLIRTWASAPTPLAAQQALLQARWDWLAMHDPWFTFRDDELAVYAARLMLLGQWRHATAEKEDL